MKKKMMSAVMAAAVAAAFLGGCGGKETSASPEAGGAKAEETTAQGSKETKEEKTGGAGENTEAGNADSGEYTVAVVKQMDHASLDEIAAAVCEEPVSYTHLDVYKRQGLCRFGQAGHAVHGLVGVEGPGHHVGKGRDHQPGEEPAEYQEQLPAQPADVFFNQKSHGLTIIFYAHIKSTEVCDGSKEDAADEDP